MDFNGNGKMDFLLSYKWNNKAEILEYDQSIAGFKHIYGIGNNQFPTQYHKHLKTGDFNGDGKTDLVYYVNNKWMIAYSKGNDFVEYDATTLWFLHNYNPELCSVPDAPEVGFYFDVADVNADGKDDIIERHFHSNGFIGHSDNGLNIYYSKGFGFKKVYMGMNFTAGKTSGNFRRLYNNLISDFDGDGKKDILLNYYNVQGSATGEIFIESFKAYNHKLNKITYINKHAYNYTYKPLSNCNSNLYTRANNLCIGKALSIKPAMFVVESFNSKVDGLLDKTLLYKYTDLLYHKHGRGLMGFTSMTIIDEKTNGITNTNKNIIVNEFKENIEFLYKLDLYRTTNYLVASGSSPNSTNQISQKIYTNTSLKTTSQNNNINFFYTNYLVETNNLTGLKKTTCFEYNEDGNLIHTQESFMKINSASGADEFTNTSVYKYAQFNSWLPSSLIISRNCKIRYNGSAPYYTQSEMSYHANGNLRTSEYYKNNLSYYYKEIVNYDKYGNISSTSIDTANNPTTNNFKNKYYTYTNGRFLQKVKNGLNQETLFEYEPLYGNKIAETTAGGFTTSYEYDNWGKLTKTTLPSGNYENITFNWASSNTDNIYYYVTKTNNTGNTSWEYYNALDQKVRAKAIGFNGKIATQSWTYNSDNLPITESNLYDATNTTTIANTQKNTENTYDKYKRPETTTYNGTLMATYIYEYGSTKTTIKDAKNRLKSSTLNATGLIETSEDNGGTIGYKYGSHNQLIETVTNGSTISIDYNVQLNKISMNDPNSGAILYDYNAFGELIGQKDAKNNIYYYKYDELGRLIQKWGANDVYTYSFYNTVGNKNLNQIQKEEFKVNGVSKHKKEYTYYTSGLLQTVSETAANNTTYATNYYYNSNQRLLSIEYPTIHLKYLYDDYNNLKTIVNNSTNDLLWTKNNEDVDGKLTSETYGNGFTTNYTYDANKQLSGINSAHGSNSQVAFKANYTFELKTGNLLNRQYNNNTNEDFEYDNLDRLTMIEETINNNSKTKAYNYGANGNITSIENGGYHLLKYQSSKPNALTDHKFENTYSIRFTVPSAATTEHEYTYTKFDKIQHIEQSGEAMLDMEYGIDQQRIQMVIAEYGNITIENYYVNSANLEIKNGIMYTYLYAEGKPFAIHKNIGFDGELYYLHLDNQGSLMAISDNTGNVIENRSYDAWGRPRNPDNWEYDQSNTFGGGGFGITTRGYTMHENLEMFNLINMNGRLYDPLLGRMLSPDNYIQAPDNTQSYNRYSYCINNPLKYTDPSGDFWHLLIGAVIGGTINWIANGAEFSWEGLGYFGIGAAAGALGAGVGAGISSAMAGGSFGAGFVGSSAAMTASSSFISGAAIGGGAGFSSGFTTGFGNGLMQKQSIGDALWSGTKSGLIGGTTGALLGGIIGGIDAYNNDRNFWTGKLPEGGDNRIWGEMTIKARGLGEGSSSTDGHSWIELKDANGKTTSYGTWGNQGDQEFLTNFRGDIGTHTDVLQTQKITFAQKLRFDNFISKPGNTNWSILRNCSAFSSKAFNYTTGLNVMAHPFLVPVFTPSWLVRTITY
jgi:RHS repeat-associated protein